MNALIAAYGETIRESLFRWPINEPFSLQELVAAKWNEISETIGGKQAGRLFAEAVEAGQFPNVIFDGIRRSGRQNQYRRVR